MGEIKRDNMGRFSKKKKEVQMCHCGQPLHYPSKKDFMLVQGLVDKLGEYVQMPVGAERYWVQRHYIALHHPKDYEIPLLGFKKV